MESKPWSLVLTLDDSGTEETGKMQMSAALELDQIFSANDLFPLTPAHQLYTAVDYGKVRGPATEYLSGTELVGGAVGFRGKVSTLQYDVSVGWPFKKPTGFTTIKQVYGFQLVTQF